MGSDCRGLASGAPTVEEPAPGAPTAEEPAQGAPTVEEPAPGAPTVEEQSPGAPTVEELASGVFSFEKPWSFFTKTCSVGSKSSRETGLRALDPRRFPLSAPNPVEPAQGVPGSSETVVSP